MDGGLYRQAREEFEALLGQDTIERDWQRFFAANPFVFSEALPVRMIPEDIVPLGRPGKSEPDFVFFPRDTQLPHAYGIIEIKRPDTTILTVPRKNIVMLSRDADTAHQQAIAYSRKLELLPKLHPARMVAIGSELHVFLIVGLSDEIAEKVCTEEQQQHYRGLLEPPVHLYPYDTLFEMFSARVPPHLHLLVPNGGGESDEERDIDSTADESALSRAARGGPRAGLLGNHLLNTRPLGG